MKNLITQVAQRVLDRLVTGVIDRQISANRTSASTKIALKQLYLSYRNRVEKGDTLPAISETAFRVFSQFDEDGIIIYLLAAIGMGPRKFLDIGGGDGLHASNCANLALNFGFHGVFIDADLGAIKRGMAFYRKHPDTSLYPPVFKHAVVKRNNINQLIRDAGLHGEIDLLSIDIDGNDYWIWESIECVKPRIVVIESHIEFGMNSIVVPYEENYIWGPGKNPHYMGASPVAMTKLAHKLGYRLVGTNQFGFNLFFVRNDLGNGVIPEITVEEVFKHDRNKERMKLFEEIKDLKYDVV